ncbi:MAG: hypothetical protein JWM27_1714 [Gemmatimonadetes bacterium]|nr:hypothetical protein [Gemmatimonadota bacterium]
MLVLPLLLAACGPGHPGLTPELAAGTPIPRVEHGANHGFTVSYSNAAVIATEEMPVTADVAWQALPRAYAELGIDVKLVDPASHTLGNLQFRPHGGIHGKRLSEYFDCGVTMAGVAMADVHALHVSVRTQIEANGTTSRAHTLVEATARSMDGTSNDAVPCISRGKLEPLIAMTLLTSL